MLRLTALLAGCALQVACSNPAPSVQGDDKRLAEYDRQTKVVAEQQATVDAQLKRAGEQARRLEALLSRWEAQADRYDAILSRWESQPQGK